jgi:hypothetical protein
MRVRKKATLVAALTFAVLAVSFGCQGEEAQGGSTSGSSGVTIQVGDGILDSSAPQGSTSGEYGEGKKAWIAAGLPVEGRSLRHRQRRWKYPRR